MNNERAQLDKVRADWLDKQRSVEMSNARQKTKEMLEGLSDKEREVVNSLNNAYQAVGLQKLYELVQAVALANHKDKE